MLHHMQPITLITWKCQKKSLTGSKGTCLHCEIQEGGKVNQMTNKHQDNFICLALLVDRVRKTWLNQALLILQIFWVTSN